MQELVVCRLGVDRFKRAQARPFKVGLARVPLLFDVASYDIQRGTPQDVAYKRLHRP